MKKKIKVAHIITRLIVGGAQENTISTVLGLMDNPEYEVTLITGPGLGPEGSLEKKARAQGIIPVIINQMRREINPLRDCVVFFQLLRHFIKNKYDIIHTHSSKAGILGRLAAYVARCPVIIHTIHGLAFHPYEKKWRNVLYIFLEKICARLSTRIITVSDTMRDKALAAGVGIKERFVTIYSGMDIDSFITCGQFRESTRKKLKIAPDDLVVGKVARLFHLKGHDFVIDCAREIIKKYPSSKFLFVGDGILKDELMEKIRSYGLENHFIFTGLVPPDKIPLFISAMDVLVHASLREGLARALPQAMAAGRAVVALDIDSANEIVIDGKTGFLIAPDNKKSFTEAVIKLLSDNTLRTKMGSAGRKIVVPQFSINFMVDKIESLYRELLSCG